MGLVSFLSGGFFFGSNNVKYMILTVNDLIKGYYTTVWRAGWSVVKRVKTDYM